MTLTIPYVRDLRATATSIAAYHITAGWHGRNEATQRATVEAALEAAAPFLVDAYLIEEAHDAVDRRGTRTRRRTRRSVSRVWRRAKGDPYRYLQRLERRGRLRLRTLRLADDAVTT